MKIKTTLLYKVLFYYLFSLFVLVGVLLLVFRQHFRLDPNSFIRNDAHEHLRSVARLISNELDNTPEANWGSILERFSDAYDLQFQICFERCEDGINPQLAIPEEIKRKIEELPMPPSREERLRQWHIQRDEQEGREPRRRGRMHFGKRRTDLSQAFFIKSKYPKLYWVGLPMRFPGPPEAPFPPRHGVLLIASSDMSGGGLFFNPLPWILVSIVVIALTAVLWIPLVRNITQPLRKVTAATQKIAKGQFDVKVDEGRSDEIGELGTAINDMASRLDGLYSGQKRFLGDVAHELASPIARIQLGLGILENNVSEENADRVQDVIDEAHHMSNLVNELLSFSRAEINPGKVELKPTEILEITKRVADREKVNGEELKLEIPEGLVAIADPELLARALSNLLRNSLTYAKGTGPIEISARQEGSSVSITVKDNGPGVPESQVGQLFEPFYRVDAARVKETGGVGLGLAIVKTCVQACRGNVRAQNVTPHGLAVIIELDASKS